MFGREWEFSRYKIALNKQLSIFLKLSEKNIFIKRFFQCSDMAPDQHIIKYAKPCHDILYRLEQLQYTACVTLVDPQKTPFYQHILKITLGDNNKPHISIFLTAFKMVISIFSLSSIVRKGMCQKLFPLSFDIESNTTKT